MGLRAGSSVVTSGVVSSSMRADLGSCSLNQGLNINLVHSVNSYVPGVNRLVNINLAGGAQLVAEVASWRSLGGWRELSSYIGATYVLM